MVNENTLAIGLGLAIAEVFVVVTSIVLFARKKPTDPEDSRLLRLIFFVFLILQAVGILVFAVAFPYSGDKRFLYMMVLFLVVPGVGLVAMLLNIGSRFLSKMLFWLYFLGEFLLITAMVLSETLVVYDTENGSTTYGEPQVKGMETITVMGWGIGLGMIGIIPKLGCTFVAMNLYALPSNEKKESIETTTIPPNQPPTQVQLDA